MLYQDIAKLRALAYPDSMSPLLKTFARDAFLQALNNQVLRVRPPWKWTDNVRHSLSTGIFYKMIRTGQTENEKILNRNTSVQRPCRVTIRRVSKWRKLSCTWLKKEIKYMRKRWKFQFTNCNWHHRNWGLARAKITSRKRAKLWVSHSKYGTTVENPNLYIMDD